MNKELNTPTVTLQRNTSSSIPRIKIEDADPSSDEGPAKNSGGSSNGSSNSVGPSSTKKVGIKKNTSDQKSGKLGTPSTSTRPSIQVSKDLSVDNPLLTNLEESDDSAKPFFLTEEELEVAFRFFSSDGKKITRDDLKQKLELICPNLTLKEYKLFFGGTGRPSSPSVVGNGGGANGGRAISAASNNRPNSGDAASQDLMGLRELKNLLLKKDLATLHPVEEAFRLMGVNDGMKIPPQTLAHHLQNMNPRKFVYKNDHSNCLKLFDADNDGFIGLEDYRKITVTSKILQPPNGSKGK